MLGKPGFGVISNKSSNWRAWFSTSYKFVLLCKFCYLAKALA